jgi:ElaB/YqjD/DUF883 family membrane-anchored ribosome-binding protein
MNNRINTDTLVSDLKTVVRDSEALLGAMTAATGEKADSLKERLGESLCHARETCRKLEDKTKETVQRADTVIREHPYQSIGVAIGVGVLIGALIARK